MSDDKIRSPLDKAFDEIHKKNPEGFREDFEEDEEHDQPYPDGVELPHAPRRPPPTVRYPHLPEEGTDVADLPPVDTPKVHDEDVQAPGVEPEELPHVPEGSEQLPPLVDESESPWPWGPGGGGAGGSGGGAGGSGGGAGGSGGGVGGPGGGAGGTPGGTTSAPPVLPPTLAWAFYVPRHSSRRRWGIYLYESGVETVSRYLLGQVRRRGSASPISSSPAELARWAAYFLYRHEAFHFITELFAFQAEEATAKTLYSRYDRIYAAQLGTSKCVEEVLANFAAVGEGQVWGKWGAPVLGGKIRAADLFLPICLRQPPGYRDVIRLLRGSYYWDVDETRTVLGNHIITSLAMQSPAGASFAFFLRPGVLNVPSSYLNVPSYLICDRGGKYMPILRARNARPITFRLRKP